jgi:hypothetical protein
MSQIPNQQKPFQILWSNLRGGLKEDFENGQFEGMITGMMTNFGKIVLTALFPAAAPILTPLGSYLTRHLVTATYRTLTQVHVNYRARVTSAGVAVLEQDKQIVTPLQRIIKPPSRLVIPTNTLVQPAQGLRFTPSQFGRSGTTGTTLPRLGSLGSQQNLSRFSSSTTPFQALMSQQNRPGQFTLRTNYTQSRLNQGLNRHPNLRPLNEIEYPSWVFRTPQQSSIGRLSNTLPGLQATNRFGPLMNTYLRDQRSANQLRNFSASLGDQSDYDFDDDDDSLVDKFLDFLDDIFG